MTQDSYPNHSYVTLTEDSYPKISKNGQKKAILESMPPQRASKGKTVSLNAHGVRFCVQQEAGQPALSCLPPSGSSRSYALSRSATTCPPKSIPDSQPHMKQFSTNVPSFKTFSQCFQYVMLEDAKMTMTRNSKTLRAIISHPSGTFLNNKLTYLLPPTHKENHHH